MFSRPSLILQSLWGLPGSSNYLQGCKQAACGVRGQIQIPNLTGSKHITLLRAMNIRASWRRRQNPLYGYPVRAHISSFSHNLEFFGVFLLSPFLKALEQIKVGTRSDILISRRAKQQPPPEGKPPGVHPGLRRHAPERYLCLVVGIKPAFCF